MLCLMHLIHHAVHMYIKNSKKKKEEKKSFGLGALGFQVMSIHFPKKKISNFFLKTFFCSFKDSKIFPKASLSKNPNFFFKSLLFKRIQDDPFGKVSSKS